MTVTDAARRTSGDPVHARDPNAASDEASADSLLQPDEVYQHLVDALRQRDRKIEHLEIALGSNRTIGVAVGILMATLKCPRDEAFSALAVCSNKLNRKVVDIADYVERTGALPSTQADVDVESTRFRGR